MEIEERIKCNGSDRRFAKFTDCGDSLSMMSSINLGATLVDFVKNNQ